MHCKLHRKTSNSTVSSQICWYHHTARELAPNSFLSSINHVNAFNFSWRSLSQAHAYCSSQLPKKAEKQRRHSKSSTLRPISLLAILLLGLTAVLLWSMSALARSDCSRGRCFFSIHWFILLVSMHRALLCTQSHTHFIFFAFCRRFRLTCRVNQLVPCTWICTWLAEWNG